VIFIPKEPRRVGMLEGKFYPCPQKHVCVSTQSDESDKKHYIQPLTYDSKEEAMEKILEIIKSFKRTKILEKENIYIHAEFTTALFRFKDDVEFYFDENKKLIHFKSQSRIGGYDWNANRNRMEKIRKSYLAS
jgi:uncharacterized protein (DUF1499 family)